MFRQLLRIPSRAGRPGTLLQLGDSGGRLLYLTAEMSPVSIAVALERQDVADLVVALGEWLEEQEDRPAFPAYRSADGRSWEPAPLVAGRISAGRVDAQLGRGTVQLRTVPPGELGT